MKVCILWMDNKLLLKFISLKQKQKESTKNVWHLCINSMQYHYNQSKGDYKNQNHWLHQHDNLKFVRLYQVEYQLNEIRCTMEKKELKASGKRLTKTN